MQYVKLTKVPKQDQTKNLIENRTSISSVLGSLVFSFTIDSFHVLHGMDS